MLLILITPEKTAPGETEIVNQLFKAGLERLHLRKPSFTEEDHRNYIEAIEPQYHLRIVVHGSYGLVSEYNLGGIHRNSAARNGGVGSNSIGHLPHGLISTSFHGWQEVEENDFGYRYVFISPVFDSISKAGYKAAIDLQGAMAIKRKRVGVGRYCPAIIGLGGVGEGQIETLYKHGFDGAAVLGAVWCSADAVNAFRAINERVKTMRAD